MNGISMVEAEAYCASKNEKVLKLIRMMVVERVSWLPWLPLKRGLAIRPGCG